LQQKSSTGTVVKVPGIEIDPAHIQRELAPIIDSLSRLMRNRPSELAQLEVALSITPTGDVAFLRSGGEPAIKLIFTR
jgi:hypothetical protein